MGKTPVNPSDVERRIDTLAQLNSGMSRSYVDGRAAALSTPKATKTYTDTQDALYQLISYYQTQDALNVPTSSVGQPSGVASLNGSTKIPTAQIPILGTGVLKGPYGVTSFASGTVTTGSTPALVCTWTIGATAVNFQPLVFMSLSVGSATRLGQPIIEVRMGDNTQTTYASQTLVAKGYGRANYADYSTVTVLPASNAANAMQDGVQHNGDPNMNLRLTAWLYEPGTHTVSTSSSLVACASAFLFRVAT